MRCSLLAPAWLSLRTHARFGQPGKRAELLARFYPALEAGQEIVIFALIGSDSGIALCPVLPDLDDDVASRFVRVAKQCSAIKARAAREEPAPRAAGTEGKLELAAILVGNHVCLDVFDLVGPRM